MTRHFLAYATANEGRWFRDRINFRRLARFDPGVPAVEVIIAVSEARARDAQDARSLAALRGIAASSRHLRVHEVMFKANLGRDFSSWQACLKAIADQGAHDEDYVLCLNRSAFGPTCEGWYAAFTRQIERDRRASLCGNSINFEGYRAPPGPAHTHVQTYAFLGRVGDLSRNLAGLPGLSSATRDEAIRDGEIEMSRRLLRGGAGITSLAWPRHFFFEDRAHDPRLPQHNVSFSLATTPFRHWASADDRGAAAIQARLGGRVASGLRRLVGGVRDALLPRVLRIAARRSKAVPYDGVGAPLGELPAGSYLLSAEARVHLPIAICSRRERAASVPLLISPGASAHLLRLERAVPEAEIFPVGLAPTGVSQELRLARVSKAMALLIAALASPDTEPARFGAGRQRPLRPPPPGGASPSWSEWSNCLQYLWMLGLEHATPDSPLLQDGARPRGNAEAKKPDQPRVAAHVHLHYPDLWPEMAAALESMPGEPALFLTAPHANEALFARVRAAYPQARIVVSGNRGRDIAPFLRLLVSGALNGFDYVCKLHGKKSASRGDDYLGRAWRRRCLAELAGSPAQVMKIIQAFERDPTMGIIGPAGMRLPNPRVAAASALGRLNRRWVDELLARCGQTNGTPNIEFFAGSMFWFRPSALRLAGALGISPDDFPEEPLPRDGSLAHALERVIPTLAGLSGYRIDCAPDSERAGVI